MFQFLGGGCGSKLGGSGRCLGILGCEGRRAMFPREAGGLGCVIEPGRFNDDDVDGVILFLITGCCDDRGRPVGPTL